MKNVDRKHTLPLPLVEQMQSSIPSCNSLSSETELTSLIAPLSSLSAQILHLSTCLNNLERQQSSKDWKVLPPRNSRKKHGFFVFSNGILTVYFSCKLELNTFLQQEKIDVALITETHCTSKYYFSSSRNYHVFHAFHPTEKAQGGSAIYAQRTLTFTLKVTVTTSNAQICAIRVQFESLLLSLASLYCSLSCKLDAVDFDIHFRHLQGTWILGGDYNAKHPM